MSTDGSSFFRFKLLLVSVSMQDSREVEPSGGNMFSLIKIPLKFHFLLINPNHSK